MNDFNPRLPLNGKLKEDKRSGRAVCHYRIYDKAGRRKSKSKYFKAAFGSPEATAEFNAWLAGVNGTSVAGVVVGDSAVGYSVAELLVAWLKEENERAPDKRTAGFRATVADALAPWHDLPVAAFRSSTLKTLRAGLVAAAGKTGKRGRPYINKIINEIKRVFSWGVVADFVPAEVVENLNCLKSLRKKDAPALRGKRITPPANPEHLAAAIAATVPTIAVMMKLQSLSGLRPDELFRLKWENIDTSGNVWTTIFKEHKTAGDDGDAWERKIYFSAEEQALLFNYQESRPEPGEAFIFTPRASAAYGMARRPGHNKPVAHYLAAIKPTIKNHFDRHGYYRAIQRACRRAGVPPFTPYSLRHLCAKVTDEKHGREAVAAKLGHKQIDTAAIYAKRNNALAERIAAGE